MLIFRFSLQETPAYSMSKGDIISAEKLLNKISLKNTGKEFILNDMHSNLLNADNYRDSIIKNEDTNKTSKKYLILQLFQRDLILATISLSLVIINKAYFFTSYSYCSIINYMPEFLSEFSTSEAYLMIVIQQICTVPGTILATWLVESTLGRKYTIASAYALSGICCYLFYIDNSPIYVRNIIDLLHYWINLFFYFTFL